MIRAVLLTIFALFAFPLFAQENVSANQRAGWCSAFQTAMGNRANVPVVANYATDKNEMQVAVLRWNVDIKDKATRHDAVVRAMTACKALGVPLL